MECPDHHYPGWISITGSITVHYHRQENQKHAYPCSRGLHSDLDAQSYKVYRAVTDTVTSNPRLKIISRDDHKRVICFRSGTSKVKMEVDSLGEVTSKITVSVTDSVQPPAKTTEVAVKTIQGVCKKLNIKCTVEEK